MTGARWLAWMGLLVACGGGSSGTSSMIGTSQDAGAVTSGEPSIGTVLDAYLKERAVENAFFCECDVTGPALDECLDDAVASPQLTQCLTQAVALAAKETASGLSCITQVTRQFNDCMARVKSCESEEASSCERALEAQQLRCANLPLPVQPAWRDCKSRFDPNYAD
jgi:hypothetical protein